MYGLKKRQKDESGLIQGDGTGTSDDIKKDVPTGSYIMPADSTQQIGTDNLKNMGNPTPVNLSNGEFQLPPEQVHQVGVQTLDAMKNQTHVPVDQPQLGFKPGQNKPELFFANGGLVPSAYPSADDIRKAQRGINVPSSSHAQDFIGRQTAQQAGSQPSTRGQTFEGQARNVTPVNRQLPATTGNAPATNANVRFPQFNTPTTGQMLKSSLGNGAKGLGAFHLAASGIGGAVTGYNTPTEDYRERFGMETNDPSLAGDLGVRGLGVLSDVGNAASYGILGRNFADKQRINAENANAAQQKRFDEWNAKKNIGQEDKPVAKTNNQNTPATNTPATNNQNTQQQSPYAIQQKGNSFSYANPSAAAQAREQGVPEGQASNVIGGIRPVNDPRGVANLFANTREMGPSEQQIQNAIAQREMNIGLGMRGYGNNPVQAPQRNEAQEAERQAVIRAASTPIAGARGLTANQVRTLSDLQQGEDNRSNDIYKTDANNAAALQREAMGQAGQNYRTELNEQGTNNRYNSGLNLEAQKFQATNDLANREFNLNATEKGFGIRNSARVEKLYEQYDKAETDEQRQSIQEKINRYSGNKADTDNPYITVKRGEILDEKGNTIQPAGEVLFHRKTGQTIDPLAQMKQNMQQPLQNHIDALKKNPAQAAQFDEIYGQGASAKYLK